MHRYLVSQQAPLPGARNVGASAWLCAALLLACAPSFTFAAPPPPSEPELRLSARGSFNVTAARAGDTILYRLRVEWNDIPAAVMLLPGETLDAPGFMAAGVSTMHRKSTANGSIVNITEFSYALVPREPGTAKVAPFTLRYRNGLTGREEGVSVPGSLLEIVPARKSFTQRGVVRVLGVLAVIAALAGFWRGFTGIRRARRRNGEAPAAPGAAALSEALSALRRRTDTAESRVWLADAERLSTGFLCRKLGIANPAHVRFEAALDQYLERHPPAGPGDAAAWSKLRDLFHEARYAGTRREPHELREAWRQLTVCLQSSGSPSSGNQPSSLQHQGEQPS